MNDNHQSEEPRSQKIPMIWADDRFGDDFCCHCNKSINLKTALWVEVVDGGNSVCVPGTGDKDDDGYMGWFPIGSTCQNKFKGFCARVPV